MQTVEIVVRVAQLITVTKRRAEQAAEPRPVRIGYAELRREHGAGGGDARVMDRGTHVAAISGRGC